MCFAACTGCGRAHFDAVDDAEPTDAADLVGWWRLDDGTGDTAIDSSISGEPLTLDGGTWTADGRIGGGLTFGSSADLAFNTGPAALDLAGSWTVAAWIRLDAYPPSGKIAVLVNKRGGAGDNFDLLLDNGHFDAGLGFAADFNASGCCDDHATKQDVTPSLSVWHHVAAVYDESQQLETLYVDGGAASGASTAGSTPEAGAGMLSIGNNSLSTDPVMSTLDDIRVYKRALSPAEVARVASGDG